MLIPKGLKHMVVMLFLWFECTYLAFIEKRGAGLSAFDLMTEDEDLSWLLSKELPLG